MNLVTPDLNKLTSGQYQRATSRWETSIGAGVGATQDPTPCPKVFRDRIESHRLTHRIREAGKKSREVLFEGLPRKWLSRSGITVRAIRRKGVAARIDIPATKAIDISSDTAGDLHDGHLLVKRSSGSLPDVGARGLGGAQTNHQRVVRSTGSEARDPDLADDAVPRVPALSALVRVDQSPDEHSEPKWDAQPYDREVEED